MSRVVVVGAGMGGLAVAARLARLRHSVTVVEQASVVGGKLGRASAGGFSWDTGPSLVTLPQTLRDLFVKTGRPIEAVLELEHLDPLMRYRFPDGTRLDLPGTGAADRRRAIDAALGAGAGGQWEALLDRGSRIWDATRRDFVESALEGRGTLLRMAVRRPRDIAAVAPWRTLRGLGRHYLQDPRLGLLLDRYATYSGSDPRHAPAALAVVPYVEQSSGGWYVRGGLRRLAEAVHERALDRGVTFVHGARVVTVCTTGGRADGVRLADGRVLPADVVVSDVDAATLYGELLPRPREQRALARAPRSYSAFALMLGLRGRTADAVHHTVLFADEADAEFDALRAGRPATEPTVTISAPDDSALRPDDDSESWFVLVNAPRQGDVDWDAPGCGDAYADQLLAVMAGRGLDVRDRVVVRRVRTPADIERDTRSPGGAIYGTSSDGPRAAFRRPRNRSAVPGLFLVGGSAHPGGGLPLVTLSAAIVADMVGPA